MLREGLIAKRSKFDSMWGRDETGSYTQKRSTPIFISDHSNIPTTFPPPSLLLSFLSPSPTHPSIRIQTSSRCTVLVPSGNTDWLRCNISTIDFVCIVCAVQVSKSNSNSNKILLWFDLIWFLSFVHIHTSNVRYMCTHTRRNKYLHGVQCTYVRMNHLWHMYTPRRAMELWSYGAMEPWSNGAMEQCSNVAM